MELAEFEQVLVNGATAESDDIRNEATRILSEFQEEDFGAFITTLVEAIFDTDNPQAQRVGICLLHQQVRESEQLLEFEMVTEFWMPFTDNLLQVLSFTTIERHIQMMIMDCLAKVIIVAANNDSVDFQEKLLAIYKNNLAYEDFIVHAISCAINEAQNLCGFDLETLIDILGSPCPEGVTSFIPRFSLFFGIGKTSPESEELQGMIAEIIDAVPPEDIDAAFQILIDFCESEEDGACVFLMPECQTILSLILEVVKDVDSDARINGMLLMTAILKKFKYAVADSEIYQEIMTTLVGVMAEVPDDAPLMLSDESLQLEPFVVAADTFRDFIVICDEDEEGVDEIAQSFIEFKDQVWEEASDWRPIFAVLLAISRFGGTLYQFINTFNIRDMPQDKCESLQLLWGFIEPIFDLVLNKDTYIRLRVMAAEVIASICKTAYNTIQCILMFHVTARPVDLSDDFFECIEPYKGLMDALLTAISGEDDPTVIYYLVHSVNYFITKNLDDAWSDSLENVYAMLKSGLEESQDEVMLQNCFITGIGAVGRIFMSDYEHILPEILIMFDDVLHNDFALESKILCISKLSEMIYNNYRFIREKRDDYIDQLKMFVTAAVELRIDEDDLSDVQRDQLTDAIKTMLRVLYDGVADIATSIFPRFAELAKQGIEIIEQEEMLGNFSSSALVRLKSQKTGYRQYVEKTAAYNIADAISMVTAVSWVAFSPELMDEIMAIIEQWVKFSHSIPKIDCEVWKLIKTVFIKEGNPEYMLHVPIEIFLESFKPDADIGVLKVITEVITRAVDVIPVLPEETVLDLLNQGYTIMEMMIGYLSEQVQWKCLQDDSMTVIKAEGDRSLNAEIHDAQCISGYFRVIMQKYDIGVSFFQERIDPMLPEMMGFPATRFIAVWMYSEYLSCTGDYGKIMELKPILDEITEQVTDADINQAIFELLQSIFEKHPAPPDVAQLFFEFFQKVLENPDIMSEKSQIAEDAACIALSCLIRNNKEYFEPEATAEIWNEFLPIWVQQEQAEVVYALLADFLEMNLKFYQDPDEFRQVIERIFTGGILIYAHDTTKSRLSRWLQSVAHLPMTQEIIRGMMEDDMIPQIVKGQITEVFGEE